MSSILKSSFLKTALQRSLVSKANPSSRLSNGSTNKVAVVATASHMITSPRYYSSPPPEFDAANASVQRKFGVTLGFLFRSIDPSLLAFTPNRTKKGHHPEHQPYVQAWRAHLHDDGARLSLWLDGGSLGH
jgi:hypothetical protein